MLEEQLEVADPGAIDELAAAVTLGGKVKGTARRAVTAAFTVRTILLMTLTPIERDSLA